MTIGDVRYPIEKLRLLKERGYKPEFREFDTYGFLCWKHEQLDCRIIAKEVDECSLDAILDIAKCREYMARVELGLE